MQNAKTTNKSQKASRLAVVATLIAIVCLTIAHFIPLDFVEGHEVPVALPFWVASAVVLLAFILSIAKTAISRTWRGRLLGVVLILVNLTVMAMSAFSIVLSHVNFMG